jgi:hypothetical protein
MHPLETLNNKCLSWLVVEHTESIRSEPLTEVAATFVKSGKYRWHRSEWQLVTWETALPSRLEIRLPADFEQQVEAAKLMQVA